MREMGMVYRRIRRPHAALVEGFGRVSVATVHEALGRANLMDLAIRPLVPGVRVAGPAITATCAIGDNLAMHTALSLAERGDVLVVSHQGSGLGAQWGSIAMHQAIAIGLQGVVVDGGARDVAEIREQRFPVWARHVSAWGSDKRALIGVNVPISCGGLVVNPGDFVVADDDGVVVVPVADADAVLQRAIERDEREAAYVRRIAAGERLFDILGFAEALKKAGASEVDDAFRAEDRS